MTLTHSYVLGSARFELDRLDLQAAYYRAATVAAMRAAGIGPGMRVLDIGSGTGAVAIEAARLVGPHGWVHGLDAAEDPVRTATANVKTLGLDNVDFEQADITTWSSAERFDALTGRLVTMYLPNRGETIARLAGMLRPRGIVLLEEFAMSATRQVPAGSLLPASLDLVLGAFHAVGVPTDLGLELGEVFRTAGLGDPTMLLGGRWEDGPDATAYALLAKVVRTLLPVIISRALATEAQVDIETLEDRLRSEAAALGAGVHAPLLVSAFARTAG
jgi:SAM-dependent methyltransferase